MLTDLKFAFRQLIKNHGFTTVAALTLALGIGVNTTMFSVLNALVLQASPAPDSGRLVSIFGTSARGISARCSGSLPIAGGFLRLPDAEHGL